MFPRYILSALVLLGSAHGAVLNSTINLFQPGWYSTSVFASIVASDATATTYSLECPGADLPGWCGISSLIQGPSTVIYGVTYSQTDDEKTTRVLKIDCAITTDHGHCLRVVTMAGPYQTTEITTVTETYDALRFQSGLTAVTITAGPAGTSSTPAFTVSTASNSDPAGLSSTGSVTVAINSLPSTGGVPMITNGPLLFAGGAAAALAFGAM